MFMEEVTTSGAELQWRSPAGLAAYTKRSPFAVRAGGLAESTATETLRSPPWGPSLRLPVL